jgi:hypothetical protein
MQGVMPMWSYHVNIHGARTAGRWPTLSASTTSMYSARSLLLRAPVTGSAHSLMKTIKWLKSAGYTPISEVAAGLLTFFPSHRAPETKVILSARKHSPCVRAVFKKGSCLKMQEGDILSGASFESLEDAASDAMSAHKRNVKRFEIALVWLECGGFAEHIQYGVLMRQLRASETNLKLGALIKVQYCQISWPAVGNRNRQGAGPFGVPCVPTRCRATVWCCHGAGTRPAEEPEGAVEG